MVFGMSGAATVGPGCGTSPAPDGGQASPGASAKITSTEIRAFADAVKIADYSPKGAPAVSAASARLVFSGPKRSPGVLTELTMTYSGCDPMTCPKLDAAVMAQRAPKLREALSAAAKANPELVFETVGLDFVGGTAFGTYTLFMSVKKTDDGGVTTHSANTVDLYFHDDRQLIHVEAKARDFGADTQALLVANTPRAELEAAARAGLEAAVQAFQK